MRSLTPCAATPEIRGVTYDMIKAERGQFRRGGRHIAHNYLEGQAFGIASGQVRVVWL